MGYSECLPKFGTTFLNPLAERTSPPQACIVACHFLFRHFVLGHDVPHEPKDIYRKLQSVRKHVSPAYEHVLQTYAAHVQGKAHVPY